MVCHQELYGKNRHIFLLYDKLFSIAIWEQTESIPLFIKIFGCPFFILPVIEYRNGKEYCHQKR